MRVVWLENKCGTYIRVGVVVYAVACEVVLCADVAFVGCGLAGCEAFGGGGRHEG